MTFQAYLDTVKPRIRKPIITLEGLAEKAGIYRYEMKTGQLVARPKNKIL